MYIFDLREQNRQTIRCTPHIKDFKSSVPSRRSRLRSILGFHCDLVVVLHCDLRSPLRSCRRPPLRSSVSIAFFGLHCDLSSVSIAILSSSSIAIFGLYCDLRFRYTTNSFPTEASLNKQRADRKGSPTHSHKSNKRRGWNLCWFISTDTPFAHHFLEPTARG
jgi:hypothetical protein